MLKRLSSSTGLLLKDIEFKPGLNLIVGQYSDKKEAVESQSHGTNGIGKSSIVRLVDYLLLSEKASTIFNHKKYNFLRDQEHEICLSLEHRGKTLNIRRRFCESKKVYIRENEQPEYGYDIEEAKKVLAAIFFPKTAERCYPDGSYRNLMNFYIKDDLTNGKLDNPIAYLQHRGATKKLLVLLNLYLFGLPSCHLSELLNIWDKEEKLKNEKNVLTDFLHKITGKPIPQLRSELAVKEKELTAIRHSLDEFKLNESFKKISETIAEIDKQLAGFRRQEHQISNQLEKLRQFTHAAPNEINIEDTRKQYEAVALDLGRIIGKSLEDVLFFRASITQERLNFYGDRIGELSTEHNKLLVEIQSRDTQRAALLKTVDADTDMSLTEAWGRYASEKAQIADIRNRLDSIEKNNNELTAVQFEATTCQMEAQSALQNYSEAIENIRTLFNEIVAAAFDGIRYEADGAYLDIHTIGKQRNNSMPVEIEIDFPHLEALGQTKLATAIYDLTLFFNSIHEDIPLPDFLIHDGVFHGVEIRKKINLLNYIQEQSKQDHFQYIVTFNNDEIQLNDNDRAQGIACQFEMSEHTIISLKDRPEEMLFQFRFK